MQRRPQRSTLFPYTTLFRSSSKGRGAILRIAVSADLAMRSLHQASTRSEEHTSELQSRRELVCRLLLEKKKKTMRMRQRGRRRRKPRAKKNRRAEGGTQPSL